MIKERRKEEKLKKILTQKKEKKLKKNGKYPYCASMARTIAAKRKILFACKAGQDGIHGGWGKPSPGKIYQDSF